MNMRKIAALLMAFTLLLAMTACGGEEATNNSDTINVTDYIEPVLYGANGIASVEWELDEEAFGEALQENMSGGSLTEKLNSDTAVSDLTPEELGAKIWKELSISKTCYVNGEEDTYDADLRVSNGDKVTVKLSDGFYKQVQKDFNVNLTYDEEKSYTVKGLKDPVEIDLFDYLTFSCEKIDSQWDQYRISASCKDNTELVEGKSTIKEFNGAYFTVVDVVGDEEEEYSIYYDNGYNNGAVMAGDSLTIEVSLSYMSTDGYKPHYFKLVNTSQDFTVKNGKAVRC